MLTRKCVKGLSIIGFGWLFCASLAFAQIGDVREYVIGIGDRLNINVWGIPEFSGPVSVRLDGKITMPHLGDIQAAGLKVSSLKTYLAEKEEGKETIGKYVEDPNITISVERPAENIRISISGVVSQSLSIPRQTHIGEVLKSLLPQLPTEPPPDLRNILVVSAEGEQFPIDWELLRLGRDPDMDLRLEWGDDIRIPAGTLPTPTPAPMATPEVLPRVSYSEEELQRLFQDYPDVLEEVMTTASQVEDGVYSFDMADVSDEQKELLGEDMINLLFYGNVDAVPERLTNVRLMGISVDLSLDEVLEAYLAFPASSPEELPIIKRFREGELVEKGKDGDEDIYLKEIVDGEKLVVVEQGDKLQSLPLIQPFSKATLAGVLDLGNMTKAVFSNLSAWQSRRPRQRMFLEGDTIEEGVKVAQITKQWALLQKDEEVQLLLLRDSLNRPLPEPDVVGPDVVGPAAVQGEPPAAVQGEPPAGIGEGLLQGGMTQQLLQDLPEGALQQALPDEVRALDTFNKLFFATPIFE
jgi:hypothetical protein